LLVTLSARIGAAFWHSGKKEDAARKDGMS
jgi:hypothetical protein